LKKKVQKNKRTTRRKLEPPFAKTFRAQKMPTQRTDNQPIATTERLNTLFVGKVRQHFGELPSTNGFAQEWLAQHRAAEGTLISTDHQTDGQPMGIGSRAKYGIEFHLLSPFYCGTSTI
jgi:hypothetical protein